MLRRPEVLILAAVIYVVYTLITTARKSKSRAVSLLAILGAVIMAAMGLFGILKISRYM